VSISGSRQGLEKRKPGTRITRITRIQRGVLDGRSGAGHAGRTPATAGVRKGRECPIASTACVDEVLAIGHSRPFRTRRARFDLPEPPVFGSHIRVIRVSSSALRSA